MEREEKRENISVTCGKIPDFVWIFNGPFSESG